MQLFKKDYSFEIIAEKAIFEEFVWKNYRDRSSILLFIPQIATVAKTWPGQTFSLVYLGGRGPSWLPRTFGMPVSQMRLYLLCHKTGSNTCNFLLWFFSLNSLSCCIFLVMMLKKWNPLFFDICFWKFYKLRAKSFIYFCVFYYYISKEFLHQKSKILRFF